MKEGITEALGWYGVIAILLGFGLVSFSYVEPTSLLYQGFNATGAVGLIIDAYYDKNYQPVVLNIVWLCIALIAIVSGVTAS